MEKTYLLKLNPAQKEAVLKTEGPLLIIAGAGAGKTNTITSRVLHLIKMGVEPSSILAITFTNKAANEMRQRIERFLSEDKMLNLPVSLRERPFISTFHSLCVHILREHHSLLNLPRHFKIFDSSDTKRALKEAAVRAGLAGQEIEVSKIGNAISREKGEAKTFKEWEEREEIGYLNRFVGKMWPLYEEILREERALDFDDLLLKTVTLLKEHPDILSHYHEVFKYLHIDEYQDTNRVQYLLVRLLSRKHRNICVVGDVDQNIYSWRGARLEHLLEFEKDYPDAKVILLEENYRSTKRILDVANLIIEKNILRKEKHLFTKNSIGEKLSVFSATDEEDEAAFIADESKNVIDGGVAPREIAVLYRANFQSRAIEEAFLSKGIPYQLVGTRFFERKEVKDVLSFLRAALDPSSLSDIKRIVNIPPRGIGKITLLKIAEGKEKELPEKMRSRLLSFKEGLSRIKRGIETKAASEAVRMCLNESGIEEMYRKGKDKDEEKLENIRELVTLATRYDNLSAPEGIELLLADAALASDQDELLKNENAVKLMTVHASKGLEFDYVFISGLEDGLFPHQHMDEGALSREDAEEERRLFYVALTRARKKVYLSHAEVRVIFGSSEVALPSEFIDDIPEEYLEKKEWTKEQKRKRGIESIFSIKF